MRWAKFTNSIDLAKVVRSNLNDVLATKLIVIHIVVSFLVILTANIVHIELLVDLSHHQIEDWDNISGVILNLSVKHLVKLKDVVAVDVEDVAIKVTHFLQLLDVVWSPLELLVIIIIVIILYLLKVVNEVFEFHLNITSVNISSPEDLCVRAHLIGTLESRM